MKAAYFTISTDQLRQALGLVESITVFDAHIFDGQARVYITSEALAEATPGRPFKMVEIENGDIKPEKQPATPETTVQ